MRLRGLGVAVEGGLGRGLLALLCVGGSRWMDVPKCHVFSQCWPSPSSGVFRIGSREEGFCCKVLQGVALSAVDKRGDARMHWQVKLEDEYVWTLILAAEAIRAAEGRYSRLRMRGAVVGEAVGG